MVSREQQNKQTVRSLFETVLNGQQYSQLPQYCSPEVVMNRHGGVVTEGRDAYEEHYRELHTAFPDFEATLTHVVGEGSLVATRFNVTGTHEGTVLGMDPTGKKVNFSAQVLYRFEDRTIAEEFHQSDRTTLHTQLQR